MQQILCFKGMQAACCTCVLLSVVVDADCEGELPFGVLWVDVVHLEDERSLELPFQYQP